MWRMTIVAFLAVLLAGCEFVGAIGAITSVGVFWMNREAHKYYNTELDTMEDSVRKVLDEMEIPIEKEYMSGESMVFKADANDRFRITLNPVRYNITKVSILVNTLGDKPYAEMIYRHIDAQDGVVQFVTVEELNTAMEERPRRKPR